MKKIDVFLEKSEKLRRGYIASLNEADVEFEREWLEHFEIFPKLFQDIYSICNGTDDRINKQVFFDFLPGFRLMQLNEIFDIFEKRFKDIVEFDRVIPFLNDYSSCYYAYAKKDENEFIVFVSNDEGIEIMHTDINKFWKTIIAFYEEEVYFLDEDGYLSYDFEKEGVIGAKYNEDVDYWK